MKIPVEHWQKCDFLMILGCNPCFGFGFTSHSTNVGFGRLKIFLKNILHQLQSIKKYHKFRYLWTLRWRRYSEINKISLSPWTQRWQVIIFTYFKSLVVTYIIAKAHKLLALGSVSELRWHTEKSEFLVILDSGPMFGLRFHVRELWVWVKSKYFWKINVINCKK